MASPIASEISVGIGLDHRPRLLDVREVGREHVDPRDGLRELIDEGGVLCDRQADRKVTGREVLLLDLLGRGQPLEELLSRLRPPSPLSNTVHMSGPAIVWWSPLNPGRISTP